jgi:DNA primase
MALREGLPQQDSRALVLAAVDVVDLISQTVALKRRGRKFVGLCPFHQEKTPSFTVDPVKQAFYCFGCKASGSVFDFVMKRDRVEFKEALEILARSAGIELPQFGGNKTRSGERQAMLDALSAACRFFENQFYGQSGGGARAYLKQRGFDEATLKKFQVGLAVEGWDVLMKGPVGKKFPASVLVQAGLIKPRDKGDGHYDVFRNRIMFPIRNESGQIIAFGGRVVPGSTDPAKYLNSPQTPLFDKSRAIYGLDTARQRIVETRTAAVVEGYTDVMMAHQYGATNVVSVLGTAMTEQHVGVLRRFADRIVLLFDADSAGDAAVDRVVQLFLTQPVERARWISCDGAVRWLGSAG